MKNCKRKLIFKIASLIMIASVVIADLPGLNLHFAMAAEKQTVYFGGYYQEKLTDKNYISRLEKVDFVNDRAIVEGISFARKDGGYYYVTPIEWEVLDSDADNYLLISKKILDYHTFTSFWHESDLRSWLNEDFYNIAFTSEEKLSMAKITHSTRYYPYDDAYIDHKEPQYIETSDYVTLLDKNEAQKAAYGYEEGGEESESRVAYCSAYANSSEKADSWWVCDPAVWFYGNLQETFITPEGKVSSWFGTYSYGVRPVIKVKKSAVSTQKPDVNFDFSLSGYDEEQKVIEALPDFANMGSDTIKGPEVTVGGNTFNLWESNSKISIPLKDKMKAKYDPKTKTVEVIIGLDKEIKTPDPGSEDSRWTKTYKEIKSLVQACGHKTTTDTWNKFQKTRHKLKSFDANAVYKVKGSVAGYMKCRLNGTGLPDILESGVVFNFEAGGSVKNPLFWVVYSEFGTSGAVGGEMKLECLDSYSYNGSLGLSIEPSLAVGVGFFGDMADAKGGLKGDIKGKVTFPWKSFRECVNVSLSGSLFLKVKSSVIPGLDYEESWDVPTLELYPELGKLSKKSRALRYTPIQPAKRKDVLKNLKTETAITSDTSAAVYENAKPNMVCMDNGYYLVTYLDEVKVGNGYQAKLVYRTGDGVTWSDPIPVNSDTTFDTAAKLVAQNGKYYLIYTGSRSSINEGQDINEIAGMLDLYVSTFEDGVITNSQIIGESGKFKYGYDLVVHNDTITAVWGENDANDLMLEKGGTVVYASTLSGIKWNDATELFRVSNAIETIATGVFDNKVSVAYIYDDDLVINGVKKTIGLSGALDSAKIFDGKVYLRSDGMLYSYDGNKISGTNVSCGTNYQVYNSAIYWIQQRNFKSEILGQKINSDTPMTIIDDDSYIGSLCLADDMKNTGIVYTSQSVDDTADGNPYGVTLLKFKDTLSRYRADVSNIAYDILDYTSNGVNDFTFDITNDGTENLHQIRLVVNSGDDNIYSDIVLEELGVGETRNVQISLKIPSNARQLEAYVEANEKLEQREEEDLILEEAGGNISIEEMENGDLKVVNNSLNNIGNITLRIKDEQYGETIRTVEIDSLSAGGNRIVEVKREDWLNSKKSEKADDCYFLYCEAGYDGNEMQLDDNNVCLCLVDSSLTKEREKENNPTPIQTPVPDNSSAATASPSSVPSPLSPSDDKNDLPIIASPSSAPSPSSSSNPSDKNNDSSLNGTTSVGDDETDNSDGNDKTSLSKIRAPKKVTGLVVKNKRKKKVVLSWNWLEGMTGFQIQYAENKKITKRRKSKVVGKWTSKKTISKLKKGKTYYFRVRAYKKSSGRKIYGKWSKIKKIKIKK